VADYGRGTYVYCGYSLYRQLPAGVQGPFRLFANLLALPAVRVAERMDFMKGTELFASLPDSQLATLAKITSERLVEEGAVISSQGDPAREVYVIREGEVSILQSRDGVYPTKLRLEQDVQGPLAGPTARRPASPSYGISLGASGLAHGYLVLGR
jgi:hypothetical protein